MIYVHAAEDGDGVLCVEGQEADYADGCVGGAGCENRWACKRGQ